MTERERQLQIAADYAERANCRMCKWLYLCTKCGEDLDKDERGREIVCRKCRQEKK